MRDGSARCTLPVRMGMGIGIMGGVGLIAGRRLACYMIFLYNTSIGRSHLYYHTYYHII